ncbi:MAG: hypothetical protein IPH82_20115 [Chloroflexi bacterium]|nr:hypothetical protein [Chloroflexota bacterium]
MGAAKGVRMGSWETAVTGSNWRMPGTFSADGTQTPTTVMPAASKAGNGRRENSPNIPIYNTRKLFI